MKTSKEERKSIKSKLPSLGRLLLDGESDHYHEISISIFDHYLPREETHFIFKKDDPQELKTRQSLFKLFAGKLSQQTSIYYWRIKNKERVHIKKFQNLQDFERKCKFDTITEDHGEVYGFIIPEYSAVYEQYWDWTNRLWFTDKSKIKAILELVKKTKLYSLEKTKKV
jgi:hypothetical protein